MYLDDNQKDRMFLENVNMLKRLNTNNIKKTIKSETYTYTGDNIFEEFDDESFKKKIQSDILFYNYLIKEIDSKHDNDLHVIVEELYKTISGIYKLVNIKPEVYNLSNDDILNESENELENKVKSIINGYIKNNYYNMSKNDILNKYFDDTSKITKEIMLSESAAKHVPLDEVTNFALKSTIIKSLLKKISFPVFSETYINKLLISESYASMFDQIKLKNEWDKFDNQITEISKIITTSI
jgi:hypothetical protein